MPALWLFVVPPLAAAALAYALAPLAARLAIAVGAVDMPGLRKVHDRPTPRLGGLAVVTAAAAVAIAAYGFIGPAVPRELARGLSLGLIPLLAVSVLDDVRPVAARWKFAVHVLSASIAVACGVSLGADIHLFGPIHVGPLAAPLSVLWLVGITNAFNLIDGLDGLSAGLALIAALTMAAVFGLVGQPAMAAAALVMAGALAGFLPYNVHPARQFLGDSGATAIGFCLGTFALKGGSTLSSGFAALVPVFVMGLPIADTLIAMARRTVHRFAHDGGGVFEADRNHIHHRLLALGIGHRHAVLVLYGAGAGLAAAAFLSMFLKTQDAALFVVAVTAAGFVGVHRLGYDEFAFIRRGTMLRVYDAAVVQRTMFVVCSDLAIAAIAAYAALGLKFDAWDPRDVAAMVGDLMLAFAPLTALVFWYTGMYRGGWRAAGVVDLAHAAGAALAVSAAGVVVHRLVAPAPLPNSVFLIYALLSVVLVTMSRGSYVVLLNSQRRARTDGVPALLYGSGQEGVAAVADLFGRPAAGLRPVGFIDDNPHDKGRRVCGLPVLGTPGELPALVARLGVKAVLVTNSDLGVDRLERTAAVCERLGVHLMRLRLLLDELDDPHGVSSHGAAPSGAGEAPLPAVLVPPTPGATPVRPSLLPLPLEAEPCRRCGSRNVHRSNAHNVFERARKAWSPQRPYRCDDCGWRGWLLPLEQATPLLVAVREARSALEPPAGLTQAVDSDRRVRPGMAL